MCAETVKDEVTGNSYDEYLVDQNWDQYSDQDHQTWRTLFERQSKLLPGRVCEEYLQGLEHLGITNEGIPNFERMSERLRKLTGWEVVAVTGLVPSKPFFDLLKDKKFPAGNFIRKPEELDYLEEPDIFHDVFGHVPLLTDPDYSSYMHAYGRAGDAAMANKGVKFLARLNWYTIEFGLIMKDGVPKIYGAGIVSSFGETKYALDNPSANHVKFDLERILRTGYYIDDFQATYFVIDSFEDLFKECVERPFLPLYESSRAQEQLTPFDLVEGDEVLRKGTGEYWKDFPETKSKLK